MLRALVLALTAAAVPAAAGSGAGDRSLPAASGPAPHGSRIALAGLEEPSAVAVSRDGAIHVCETAGERISVFDRGGRLLRRWGRPGSGPGELRAPRGIALGADGRVYISNTWNHRIDVFGPTGGFERSWGSYGSASGEFIEPLGLTVDDSRVYVADSRNDRVQVFDLAGRFLFYVWSRGAGEGQLDRPVDVAAAPDGSFHVTDQGNSRVQKFDREGRFVSSWGGWGPHPGLLAEPGGIESSGGRLLVCDTHNHRVQVFDEAGAILGEWGPSLLQRPDEDASRLFPGDVAALPDGRGIVVCDAFRDRCAVLEDAVGRFSDPEIRPITSFFRAAGMAGSTLFAGAGSGAIVAFDCSGSEPVSIAAIGGHGRETFGFVRAASVLAGPERETILVSDSGNLRLSAFRLARGPGAPLRYDSARTRFLRALALGDEEAIALWPGRWPLIPAALVPGRAARDGRGRLLVIDEIGSRIVVFGDDARPIAAWGRRGGGDGELLRAADLALDRDGKTLYVLDPERPRIQALDSRGRPVRSWGSRGRGPSGLLGPAAIAAGRDGSVYVADRWAGRVQRFTSRGTLVEAWGRPGNDRGRLDKPERIFVDAAGRVLVIDAGGQRVQAFTPSGRFLWDVDVDAAERSVRRAPSSPPAPEPPAARSARRAASAGGSAARGSASTAATAARETDRGATFAADPSARVADLENACGTKVRSSDGRYIVCYRLSVDPVPLNAPFDIDVRVYETAPPGRLASMIALSVEAGMPEHGHGMAQLPQIRASGETIPEELLPDHSNVHGAVGNGAFEVRGMRFHMPGRWEIAFDIGRGALTERAQVEILLD